MANGWAPIIGLVIVACFCAGAWILPKGENQTIWRSTLILSAVSMYIMWAITFLAQLNPLIVPTRQNVGGGGSE